MTTASRDNQKSGWGRRIRIARDALGIQQKDLAEWTGIESKTLSNWEHGDAPPSQWWLVRFDELYGINPDYILSGRLGGLPRDLAREIQATKGQREGPVY